MDPPGITSPCGTQHINLNPMGIGLGVDHVTWRNVEKCIPPKINSSCGTKN